MATPIDPARYVVVPRATVRRQLALGRVLVKRKPNPASADVVYAVEVLAKSIAELTQAFADRHVENNSAVAGEDAALDLFVDDLWYVMDERLEHWQVFERPAAGRLAEGQDPEGYDYAAAIEKARKAAQLKQRLLGAGLAGLRLPHAEQAEFMRTLWTVVDQEGLEPQLTEFVGADFVEAARNAQDHYDEMVDAQSARTKGSLVNLRDLALKLQQSIQKYMFLRRSSANSANFSCDLRRACANPANRSARASAEASKMPTGSRSSASRTAQTSTGRASTRVALAESTTGNRCSAADAAKALRLADSRADAAGKALPFVRDCGPAPAEALPVADLARDRGPISYR